MAHEPEYEQEHQNKDNLDLVPCSVYTLATEYQPVSYLAS